MAVSLTSITTRIAAPAWVVACIVLGGSSAGGVLANTALQIAGGVIALWLIHRGDHARLGQSGGGLLIGAAVLTVLTLVSLVPLPPSVWTRLGGRGNIAAAYTMIGMPLPWLPVSLTPDATIAMLFSLLPPIAMFLLAHASSPEGRRWTVIAVAMVALVSVLMGVTQQVAGFRADTYIYSVTSRGGAVGFFANRNHLATLCLMSIPLMAALIAANLDGRSKAVPAARWVPPAGALLLFVVGAGFVESLAGWLLLVPTLLASVLLIQRSRKEQSRTLVIVTIVVLGLAIFAALFAPWSATDVASVSDEAQPRERRGIMSLTWLAAKHYFPTGTGWGSFVDIYHRFENPATVTATYINHAHNEYLEILLEGGLIGAALLAAFIAWWLVGIVRVWRAGGDPVARAATISIGVVLAHSFVDYPMRTAAIGAVTALCCALMGTRTIVVEPPRRRRERTSGTIMLGTGRRSPGQGGTPVTP